MNEKIKNLNYYFADIYWMREPDVTLLLAVSLAVLTHAVSLVQFQSLNEAVHFLQM